MELPSDSQGSYRNSSISSGSKSHLEPSSSQNAPVFIDDHRGRQELVARRQDESGLLGGAFWFLATICLVLAAWFVGPIAIEKYQYSVTRGRVQAEYENAVAQLKNAPLSDVSLAYQLVAQKIRPSVVSIQSESTARMGRQQFTTAGQGSGVVLTGSGYIMTNEHVVRNASKVRVTMHDRRQYEADVIGSDEFTDLAVLKIDAGNLVPAEWGNSDDLQVGSMVWAVGSPYGLEQTVTSGILSAKDRQGRESPYQEFLQTDAAVNPGNSGGPLVNANGQVVGINTSIYGEKFQGISFAVPSAVAQHVYEQIKANRKVSRGFLGVQPEMVLHDDVQRLDLPDLNGALIKVVRRDTPAAQAGIQPDDVIRTWDGHEVRHWNRLYRYIAMTKPASVAKVNIFRDGKSIEVNVPVGKRSDFFFGR